MHTQPSLDTFVNICELQAGGTHLAQDLLTVRQQQNLHTNFNRNVIFLLFFFVELWQGGSGSLRGYTWLAHPHDHAW